MTATFGDVTAEYEAMHNGVAVVDGQHELVRVAGPDAESFLDSLLSQTLIDLPDGTVVRSLLLEPRGKLRALLWVTRYGEEFLLIADAGAGRSVIDDLTRFKLRVDLTIGAVEPVAELVGPEAVERAGGLPGLVVPAPLGRVDRFFVPWPLVDDLLRQGVRRAGDLAYTAVRVEMGEPAMGRDVDESTIPQEAGHIVQEAVSFTKGCFLGQELVARIDSRGRVNRHLRGLVITENILPPDGAEVQDGATTVGTITSVSESLRVGAPIGLGLIRREVTPGTAVVIRWKGASTGAEVRDVPLVASESTAAS